MKTLITQFKRSTLRALSLTMLAIFSQSCTSIMPMLAPGADDIEPNISSDFPYESHFVEVNGSRMHYVDEGEGNPILLVHGNPSSSYLWRNVIPKLKEQGRVIAVDLIGMGKSDKPSIGYTFSDHTNYLEGFINQLRLKHFTLVLHDWGGALGIDYAMNNQENIRGIVLIEALMKPMSWDSANIVERYLFRKFRDPEDGHELIAVENYFVRKMLPMMAGRELSEAEMNAYRTKYQFRFSI